MKCLQGFLTERSFWLNGFDFVCLATRFTHFCEQDFFIRYTPQVAGKAELGEHPNHPFGGVKLPRLDAVAVVVLERVVVVVVALATGEDSHNGAIACGVLCVVRAFADGMAERVNKEGAVLNDNDAENAGEQEAAEGVLPSRLNHVGKCSRNNNTQDEADPVHILVLPHAELVPHKIIDVIDGLLWPHLENEPSNVSPHEPFGNIIRIIIVVDVFMMFAVIGGPIKT